MYSNILKKSTIRGLLNESPSLLKQQKYFSNNARLLLQSGEDLHSRPDSLTTTKTEYQEFERVANTSKNFKATWLNALNEKNKQLSEGKVIDSYMYTKVITAPIIEKTREDSFAYVVLPFKNDPKIADFYVSAGGRIRMGQLFQDLDSLAGKIAYQHTAPVEPMIVTASVDRMYLLKHIQSIADVNVVLSGSVIYTGRSSMEIAITARASTEDFPADLKESDLKDDDIFLTASFTFVARNPETHKSLAINKLLPLNEKEWRDYKRAESRIAAKKLDTRSTNLAINPPTSEESKIIHQLWSASKKLSKMKFKPSDVIPMKSTTVQSTMFMQPQYRNRHSYMIFGGYLMRQTFELAYCAAAAFSHALPRFTSLDSTTFKTPVPVGSILHMEATVVYTEQVYIDSSKVSNILNETEDSEVIAELPKSILTNSKYVLGLNDFLQQPGTLVQVKVGTWVQELQSSKLKKSGNFIFSFYVPLESSTNVTLASCETADAAKELAKGKYMMVMPETYDEMVQYIKARRRVLDMAAYVESIIG
ncbi:hypothetical protein TBLA_0E03610 [Henningerozyma blattae CBS 6284]|uniref:HotDog ACOT-type domain-containing protein n=1 Tax=Henningerozyma blattae (strain ATCC 34711 / CBS 6284 / DSM 70876 / NBRC 10599 / NRRL Y-10934 / UCD 77-7) TaxID=1071380 RepID=I2H4W3_HENB6|nr:hypothetical protein TBLA_0E03610 [Tetrapisispora blattae CBS 6284]CCH61415.1 hypothetical protein TBLA_0E03610 [Tetrapisispora blattae CBS 6284]